MALKSPLISLIGYLGGNMKIARVATSFLMAIVLLGIALYMSAIEYEYRLYMQQLHAETRLHGGLLIDYGRLLC